MNADYRIYIVLISFEIFIDHAASLKAKRSVVNRVKDRIRSRFNASVAEIGYLDKWQRAALGITLISNQKVKLQQDVDSIEGLLRDITDLAINNYNVEWL